MLEVCNVMLVLVDELESPAEAEINESLPIRLNVDILKQNISPTTS